MIKLIKNSASSWVSVVAAIAVALSPAVASAASDTKNTTVTATINAVISMTTSGSVAFSITPTSSGAVSSASDTVTVSTNQTTGYTLTLADADATTSLVSGANNITAHSGTAAAPSALAVGKWGYAVAGTPFDASYTAESSATSSTTKWAGVPASGSANTIKTTNVNAQNNTTTVWYAAKADVTQPTGAYADSVTYTATTN